MRGDESVILGAEHIEQPCSGEFAEKIYDIQSPWNSSDWTWIKFDDENSVWCGEFRGKYRGVSLSEKLGIAVVLTSDYMYVLNIKTAELVDFEAQPQYMDMTVSPHGDIFVTDGYALKVFTTGKIKGLQPIDTPIRPDDLRFLGWTGSILKMHCCEFLSWENEIDLSLDCETMKWCKQEDKK